MNSNNECNNTNYSKYEYHRIDKNSNGIDNTFIQMDELNNNSDETEPNKLLIDRKSPTSIAATAAFSSSSTNLNVSLNLTQTFLGSNVQKILARSKLFTHDSKLFGCASDEASKSIVIWDVNRNEICTKLSNMNEVLDICPIPNINKSSFIVSLADKQLRIFKKTN